MSHASLPFFSAALSAAAWPSAGDVGVALALEIFVFIHNSVVTISAAAPPGIDLQQQSQSISQPAVAKPVSYTHLTLPTILLV